MSAHGFHNRLTIATIEYVKLMVSQSFMNIILISFRDLQWKWNNYMSDARSFKIIYWTIFWQQLFIVFDHFYVKNQDHNWILLIFPNVTIYPVDTFKITKYRIDKIQFDWSVILNDKTYIMYIHIRSLIWFASYASETTKLQTIYPLA